MPNISKVYNILTNIIELSMIQSNTIHHTPQSGIYSSSSLGRVNSLDVLCSLDVIKFPSAQSMDSLSMYGQGGEDPFPWSSNPGAGTNSGLYGGMAPLGYRSTLSQSTNSFGRSSLWPSMNNLVSFIRILFSKISNYREQDIKSHFLTSINSFDDVRFVCCMLFVMEKSD